MANQYGDAVFIMAIFTDSLSRRFARIVGRIGSQSIARENAAGAVARSIKPNTEIALAPIVANAARRTSRPRGRGSIGQKPAGLRASASNVMRPLSRNALMSGTARMPVVRKHIASALRLTNVGSAFHLETVTLRLTNVTPVSSLKAVTNRAAGGRRHDDPFAVRCMRDGTGRP
jgi:hypothetical protein